MTVDLKKLANEFTSNYEVFGIVMIGAGGTGNSSLAAIMRNKINESPSAKKFVFEPSNASKDSSNDFTPDSELQENFKTLSKGASSSETTTEAQFLNGSEKIEAYRFRVGSGNETWFDVVLVDVPGRWFKTALDPDLLELVAKAHVIINTVDTPFLMEEKGRYCEAYNKSTEFFTFLKKTMIAQPTRKRMFQFVPVKSEKYTRTSAYQEELYQNWLATYKPIRDYIDTEKDCIGCYCPVSTLGGIEFSHFTELENDRVRSIFKPNGDEFSPKGAHLPLLLALRFIFEQKYANITTYRGVTDSLKGFYPARDNIHVPDKDIENLVQYFGNQTLIDRAKGMFGY